MSGIFGFLFILFDPPDLDFLGSHDRVGGKESLTLGIVFLHKLRVKVILHVQKNEKVLIFTKYRGWGSLTNYKKMRECHVLDMPERSNYLENEWLFSRWSRKMPAFIPTVPHFTDSETCRLRASSCSPYRQKSTKCRELWKAILCFMAQLIWLLISFSPFAFLCLSLMLLILIL